MIKENIDPGLFFIRHPHTEKMYVGHSIDPDLAAQTAINLLKRNKHNNKALQKAYNDAPEVVLDIESFPGKSIDWIIKLKQHHLDSLRDTGALFNVALNAEHPGKGLKRTKEHIEKFKLGVCKKVIIENVEYSSVKDAAIKLKLSRCTVSKRINSKLPEYQNWTFKSSGDI